MEETQPTERTPLIGHHTAIHTHTADPGPLPFILELEKDIYSDSDYPAVHGIIERKVDALEKSPSTVLTLKILLCLRYLSGAHFQLGRDDLVDSRSAEQNVVDSAIRCWTDLKRAAWSQAAIDEALWAEFPLESGKAAQISLIEVILEDQTHFLSSVQLDDRIALSLLRTWKNGRPRSVYDDREPTLISRAESFATPRVLHLIDLTTNLIYLVIIAHYVMRPEPFYPVEPPRLDYHFYSIVALAVCRILKDNRPSATHGTFILTVVTLLWRLPHMPRRSESPYLLLLFCFSAHIVQLLLPFSPSTSLLAPRSITFTVAIMLRNLFAIVFVPAFALFIPIIVTLLFLLIMSLSDIFMGTGLAAFDLFLFFLWLSGILFTCLTINMTLSTSSLPPATFHHPGVPASWSSYGPNVGILLRRYFCRLITAYSRPYFFPAPFNVFPLVLIQLPRGLLLVFRDKHLTNRLKAVVEPAIWRIIVMPLAFVFGVVWLWK